MEGEIIQMNDSNCSFDKDYELEFEIHVNSECRKRDGLLFVSIVYYNYLADENDDALRNDLVTIDGFLISGGSLEGLVYSADSISGDMLDRAVHFSNRVDKQDYYGSAFFLENFKVKDVTISLSNAGIFSHVLRSLIIRLDDLGIRYIVFSVDDILSGMKSDEKLYLIEQVLKDGFIPFCENNGEVLIMKDLIYL